MRNTALDSPWPRSPAPAAKDYQPDNHQDETDHRNNQPPGDNRKSDSAIKSFFALAVDRPEIGREKSSGYSITAPLFFKLPGAVRQNLAAGLIDNNFVNLFAPPIFNRDFTAGLKMDIAEV